MAFRRSWWFALCIATAAYVVGIVSGVGLIMAYGCALAYMCSVICRRFGILALGIFAFVAAERDLFGVLWTPPEVVHVVAMWCAIATLPWAAWDVAHLPTESPRTREEPDPEERAFWRVWDDGLVSASSLLFVFVLLQLIPALLFFLFE